MSLIRIIVLAALLLMLATLPRLPTQALESDLIISTNQEGKNNITSLTKLELLSLDADVVVDGISIRWVTATEENTEGFTIYRSTTGVLNDAVKITMQIIPSQGSQGGEYTFLDMTAMPCVNYMYWLAETELDGLENFYGPRHMLVPGGSCATPTKTANSTNTPQPTVLSTMTAENQFSCVNVSEVPQIECEALVALYENTDGPNWDNTTGWLETTTPCSWYGIKCEDGFVTSLILTNNDPDNLFGLQGAVPSQIGNLGNLRTLNLYDNQLSSLPDEIGNLTNLISLKLSGNQLTSLPTGIGNLENLAYFYIEYNQLSSLPAEIGNLNNLIHLFLIGNQLSSLPAEIGNLENLTNFRLQNNQLTSLPMTMGVIPKKRKVEDLTKG